MHQPPARQHGRIRAYEPFHGRMLYTINWATGRYRLQVFDLDKNKDIADAEDSGKCELIHPPR